MYGWQYTTICPFCNHVYETNHGITTHVQIRNHGDLWYIKEWCPQCKKNYYRCLVDEFALFQRMSGIKESDAVEEAILMRKFYSKSITEAVAEAIREKYRSIYSMDERDLFIDANLVSEDDFTATTCCCY